MSANPAAKLICHLLPTEPMLLLILVSPITTAAAESAFRFVKNVCHSAMGEDCLRALLQLLIHKRG